MCSGALHSFSDHLSPVLTDVHFSLHAGVNKDTVPKKWPLANKAQFKKVTQLFQEYLSTCYGMFPNPSFFH